MGAHMLSHFSRVWLFAAPWTVARQAPLSMVFSRQEYWSGLPCPPPGDLPYSGVKPKSPASPALHVDSLLLSHWASPLLLHLQSMDFLTWCLFVARCLPSYRSILGLKMGLEDKRGQEEENPSCGSLFSHQWRNIISKRHPFSSLWLECCDLAKCFWKLLENLEDGVYKQRKQDSHGWPNQLHWSLIMYNSRSAGLLGCLSEQLALSYRCELGRLCYFLQLLCAQSLC